MTATMHCSFHSRSALEVRNLGQSMMTVLPSLLGKRLNDWFDLVRPLVEFRFTSVSGTARPPLLFPPEEDLWGAREVGAKGPQGYFLRDCPT